MNIHPTLKKFGYPDTLIKEYEFWAVLLRPSQPTLGSLVLICKEDVQAFSEISSGAFAELQKVTKDIEASLKTLCQFEKINYLMLMMVDKEVHFHVIPRYENAREYGGLTYKDAGWPAVPNLGKAHALSETERHTLITELHAIWNKTEG